MLCFKTENCFFSFSITIMVRKKSRLWLNGSKHGEKSLSRPPNKICSKSPTVKLHHSLSPGSSQSTRMWISYRQYFPSSFHGKEVIASYTAPEEMILTQIGNILSLFKSVVLTNVSPTLKDLGIDLGKKMTMSTWHRHGQCWQMVS